MALTALFCMGMFRTCSTDMEITPCAVLDHIVQPKVTWMLLKKGRAEGLGIRFAEKRRVLFLFQHNFVLADIKSRNTSKYPDPDSLDPRYKKLMDIPISSKDLGYDLFLNMDIIFHNNELLNFILVDDGAKGFVFYKNESNFVDYDSSICDFMDYTLVKQSFNLAEIFGQSGLEDKGAFTPSCVNRIGGGIIRDISGQTGKCESAGSEKVPE
jgi:hypothetical protein